MMRALKAGALAGLVVVVATVAPDARQSIRQSTEPAPGPSRQSNASPERALLDRYCITCHNDRVRSGSLVLTSDKLDVNRIGDAAELWERVVTKLQSGAMPPAGRPRPDAATFRGFITSLETSLDRAAAARPHSGRSVPHRLNRFEYTNAVRDLLGLEIDGRAVLPAEASGYGFDNIGSVLSLSPGLMEQYLLAARKIARLAVGDPSQRPGTETYKVLITTNQNERMGEDLPFGSRGGAAVKHYFPLDGEYFIRVRMQKRYSSGQIRGIDRQEEIEVRIDGRRVETFIFGGKYAASGSRVGLYSTANDDQTRYELSGDEELNARFSATAGSHIVSVSFVNASVAVPETPYAGRMPVASIANFSDPDGLMGVDTIQIGPVATTAIGDTPSRRQIFLCYPKTRADESPCAARILSRLARMAYRRPVGEADVRPLTDIYAKARERSGHFERGLEAAIERLLVAPEFLFRIERDPEGVRAAPYRVSDIDIASRLSFFLWSSIPDAELLTLAERNRLREPRVLESQVRRMLADRRASALATNFAGQWLKLRNVQAATPDVNMFPEFDDNLKEAMRVETEMFIESQIREDRPLVELLTAGYTFLNQRLAEHYKVPHVYGSQFRRMTWEPGSARRGLLGHGSLLTVSSYPTRTSPVLRGKYILDLLGAPPPPPPPNIPDLEESHVEGKVLSVRERMEMHRRNPVCASCHASMDPLGFALENFDAVGKWRTVDESGLPVDAAAALPDGTAFSGAAELRDVLASRRREFVGSLIEKLLTYGLGRGVEYYDRPVIRKIIQDTEAADHTWSAVIMGVVKSLPFQHRMPHEGN